MSAICASNCLGMTAGGKTVSQRAQPGNCSAGNGAWGNNGSRAKSAQGPAAACGASPGANRAFSTALQLNRRETSNGTAYNVELSDGRAYTGFFNRDGTAG